MASHAHQHDHTHPHAHPHTHRDGRHHDHTREASQRTLLIVLALTFGYMLAEAIGGYLANSLALLSDAGHMLTDVAALTLSLFAVRFASRPATPRKTYGFYRLEILAALANGVTLIVLSLLICVEAYHRLRRPEAVQGWTLIWISTGGLAVNVISAWMLSHSHDESLNIRGALLHVIGDLLGSVAAIAAGVMIIWRGWVWADPLFSVVISLLIIYSSWRLVADAVNVLLEGAPSHINAAAVEEAMRSSPGVRAVTPSPPMSSSTTRAKATASCANSVRCSPVASPSLIQRFKSKIQPSIPWSISRSNSTGCHKYLGGILSSPRCGEEYVSRP
jgi:cobalt-zinc-cadmium efflux system protein